MMNVAAERQGHSARVTVQDPCPSSVPCLLLVSLSSQRPWASGFHTMHFTHPSDTLDLTLKPNVLTYQRTLRLFQISFRSPSSVSFGSLSQPCCCSCWARSCFFGHCQHFPHEQSRGSCETAPRGKKTANEAG